MALKFLYTVLPVHPVAVQAGSDITVYA